MKSVKEICKKSKKIDEFSLSYIENLHKLFSGINLNHLIKIEKELRELRKNNSTLYVFGNGGGAATAMTMANDLGFDVLKKTGKKTFKIISLNDNSSVMTAIANDTDYTKIFLNQLNIHFKKGDKVLIFSASGNSKNLISAAKFVKSRNGKVLSIVGFNGGKLKKLSDICLHVPSKKGDYGPVEDAQLIINHILAHWFQEKL